MDIQSTYRQEQDKLSEIFGEIERQLNGIGPRYYGDDYVEQLLDEKREQNRERLNLLFKEPYFGRLDFQEKGTEQPAPLYIGKRGMESAESAKPCIIDWRAPVASLFYSFTGGEEGVEYDAPDGWIEGWVHRKRNLSIREGILQRIVDSYVRGGDNLGVSDEFLLYRLGENKDNRLRDIVSTIQAEQDRIIRAPKDKTLIIQGAAGSGKTTVALHRLAYILYRYRDEVKAGNMVIFAPSTMFLQYISGVLPELGVGHIRQSTFAEWALVMLGPEIKLSNDELSNWFATGSECRTVTEETPGRWKGSLAYKRIIEEKLAIYERNFLPTEDFVAWEGKRLLAETMREWWNKELSGYSLYERRERFISRIKRWLEMALVDIGGPAVQKDKTRNARQRLQAFAKKVLIPDPLNFYKHLYGVGKSPLAELSLKGDVPTKLYEQTKSDLKNGEVAYEDLPALLWIRRSFKGIDGHRFDHIVIDEAQDASPFQIALLHAHMKTPSFTILGDLAQGIHEYRGIRNWEEFYEDFAEEDIAYHMLRQSYRSTTEIIEFANRVLANAKTGLPAAIPVFRSGEPVTTSKAADSSAQIKQIFQFIAREQDKGRHTIAIITRTSEESRIVHQALLEVGTDCSIIEEGQQQYKGGISVLPVYLSKGLEFDAVVLANVNADLYAANSRDAKLLYVACTRALHSLLLLYIGDCSELLAE